LDDSANPTISAKNKQQQLNLPDKIEIQFYDKADKPLRQDNLLVGIRTFATHKNDIDLSPFLSDTNGLITITQDDLKQNADNFISYGIMDYGSIESAKPDIEIYFWGNDSLTKYLDYWTSLLASKKDLKNYEKWGDTLGKRDREAAIIEKQEREIYAKFNTCFNRQTNIKKNLTLVKDTWDGTQTTKIYKVNLEL
jgi:hypothetical protein